VQNEPKAFFIATRILSPSRAATGRKRHEILTQLTVRIALPSGRGSASISVTAIML
jgi:hypothetical protein